MNVERSAAVFKALGDPQRLKILELLANPPPNACTDRGRVCACDIISLLGVSQPTVSHHMRLLVQAGLVTATRRGKWMDYALKEEGFEGAELYLRTLRGTGRKPAEKRQSEVSRANS